VVERNKRSLLAKVPSAGENGLEQNLVRNRELRDSDWDGILSRHLKFAALNLYIRDTTLALVDHGASVNFEALRSRHGPWSFAPGRSHNEARCKRNMICMAGRKVTKHDLAQTKRMLLTSA
jgi:hypothetical protein